MVEQELRDLGLHSFELPSGSITVVVFSTCTGLPTAMAKWCQVNVEKDGSLAAKFLFPEGHLFVGLLLPSKQIYVNFYMIEHNLWKIPRSVPFPL